MGKKIEGAQISGKTKKPIYRRWWFIVIMFFAVFGAVAGVGSKNNKNVRSQPGSVIVSKPTPTPTPTPSPSEPFILRYDDLRDVFVQITPATVKSDFTELLKKKEVKTTDKDYEGYSRLRIAYTKEASLHKYEDPGDYLDVFFDAEGKLNSATYYNYIHEGTAVLYNKGDYDGITGGAGYYGRQAKGTYTAYSDAKSALCQIYNIKPSDFKDQEFKNAVKDWVVEKVKNDYHGTDIDSFVIQNILGKYVLTIDLTWNVMNDKKMTDKMLKMYSDDLAATIVLEFQELQLLNENWTVPNLKYKVYEFDFIQERGRMYRAT